VSKESGRVEKDSMGEVRVPSGARYGAQTQRAVDNFPISGLRLPRAFIQALGLIKAVAAEVNRDLELLDAGKAAAIKLAAEKVASGEFYDDFPIDVFQTGSGTSTNMNANEVIATLAGDILGAKVHANDDVNMGQSSNDCIPTAIHVSAALEIERRLLPALQHLHGTLAKKAKSLDHVVKNGRTHLMDATPVRMSQEVGGWAHQVQLSIERVKGSMPRLCELAQGGTAVGTGINAHPEFGERFAKKLAAATGIPFRKGRDLFAALAGQETAVEVSGQLKATATALMKIANDLRWMNSGPQAGLAEIALPALQPGSSIMPGKVNPVIPEAMTMVCAQVVGNDAAITIGGQSGSFELNVMLPMIAHNLLQSIHLLANASRLLADKAVAGFTVNEGHVTGLVEKNPILVTALNSVIGYDKGAAIAKKAYKENRSIKDVAAQETRLSKEEIDRCLDPRRMTEGGITDSATGG